MYGCRGAIASVGGGEHAQENQRACKTNTGTLKELVN